MPVISISNSNTLSLFVCIYPTIDMLISSCPHKNKCPARSQCSGPCGYLAEVCLCCGTGRQVTGGWLKATACLPGDVCSAFSPHGRELPNSLTRPGTCVMGHHTYSEGIYSQQYTLYDAIWHNEVPRRINRDEWMLVIQSVLYMNPSSLWNNFIHITYVIVVVYL